MLFKVYTLSGSPWLTLPMSPWGSQRAQRRSEKKKKKRDQLHTECIALHPKLPWTTEQCAITILRAEECVKRGKVAWSLVGPDMHKRAKVMAPPRLEQDWILSSSHSIYAEDSKRPFKYHRKRNLHSSSIQHTLVQKSKTFSPKMDV